MEIESNTVTLVGRVNFIDIKYFESGSQLTRLLLSKKTGENEYASFTVTYFNAKSEEIMNAVEKGDYVCVNGYLVENKFTNKDGVEVKKIEINGREFAKVKFDEEQKRYVEVKSDTKSEKKATKTTEKKSKLTVVADKNPWED